MALPARCLGRIADAMAATVEWPNLTRGQSGNTIGAAWRTPARSAHE